MKSKLLLIFSFLLMPLWLFAQQRITVSGVVTEQATGEPAIGVSILVKGTTNGTVTGLDGSYTLSDVPAQATLVFSYIGMTTVEQAVNGHSRIDVRMSEDRQVLDEVVVIGYGSAKKRDLTRSIVSIKATKSH